MVLAMSLPFHHPKTGVFWLRKRVPTDLVQVLGKKEERYSLKTRDPSEAKRLHSEELAKLEKRWADLRVRGPEQPSIRATTTGTLTEYEAHQRAAWIYRYWLDKHRDNPSEQTFWRTDLFDRLWPESSLPMEVRADTPKPTSRQALDRMETDRLVAWCFEQADDVLALHDLEVDEASRLKLAKAIAAAVQRASLTLARHARGEFEPLQNDVERRDKAATSSNGTTQVKAAVSFEALFDGWAAERRPTEKTLYEWRRVIRELERHLGHEDAGRLTSVDLIAWKGALIEQGRRPKTIRDAKLAPVRAVLQWAVDNRQLPANPAERITIDIRVRAGEGQRSFSDEEATVVLKAAQESNDPVRRWVPWLCAYSGAWVSEVCQLRAEDIIEVDRIWCMKFDPDAGPLKNRASERAVPLHRALIDTGFLPFAQSVGKGPLFASLPPDKFGKRGGNGTKVLGRWVRLLGLTDPRLSPNHSWRHRLKTSARRYGLAPDIVDAITGHAKRSVGDSYGEFPMEALKRELEKLPDMLEPTKEPA